jgi:hypothetical protein
MEKVSSPLCTSAALRQSAQNERLANFLTARLRSFYRVKSTFTNQLRSPGDGSPKNTRALLGVPDHLLPSAL